MKNVNKRRVKLTWRQIVVLMALVALLIPLAYQGLAPERKATAQGSNLLVNPSFGEGWYGRQGVDGQIPNGWQLWANGQPPATDRYVDPVFTRTAPAWINKGGYVPWTGGGYQQVSAQPGATYRFSIYALIYTCDNLQNSCILENVPRTSDQSSGSRVKVGIDPNGGTDPNSGAIVWSAFSQPWDRFGEVFIEATAAAGTITVFTYNTVTTALALRETVWDDASLVQITAPSGTPGTPGATPLPPAPAGVPFVTPQQARPDGSVVHTVVEGDTFFSIIVAYRPFGVNRESILELNGWDLPPQVILIGQEIKILPPGSVNPQTGQLLNVPGGTPRPTTPTPRPASTGTAPAVTPPAGQGGVGPSTPAPGSNDIQKGGALPGRGLPKV